MKKITTLIITFFCLNCFGQNDFGSQIQSLADTISKKIVASGKKKVAVTEFSNLDESITLLGQFLSDELSSELSNYSDNLTKYAVIERSNLDLIFKEKNLLQNVNREIAAKELGKVDAADILIWAVISDFGGYYRINIKLLDTKSGNALSAFKTQFVKDKNLEEFNKVIVKKPNTGTSYSQQNFTKTEISEQAESKPKEPCDEKGFGSINLIYSRVNYSAYERKIVIRFPKKPDSNEFYYVTLSSEESKSLTNLKEGLYEYEAKYWDPGSPKGWYDNAPSISSGQIEIIKCNNSKLEIK